MNLSEFWVSPETLAALREKDGGDTPRRLFTPSSLEPRREGSARPGETRESDTEHRA